MSKAEQPFIWAVGIEDTIIGRPLRGGQSLDEYTLTGHNARWRTDLELAKAVGATAIRYGIPWHRANPAPGQYDWDHADRALNYIHDVLELEVILDLVHYGTPPWLAQSFADPAYPSAIAEYGAAAATRYGGIVNSYTPLNEPLVTASFCGLRGIWPPYLIGDRGWATVIASVAEGIQRTTTAIRDADTGAKIVHVEAVQLYSTADASLDEAVQEWRDRVWIPTDLVLGRLTGEGAEWLERHGVSADALARLTDGAVQPDVIGINYYPELSPRELVRVDGRVVHVAQDRGGTGLVEAAAAFHERYSAPLMITETAAEGDDQHRTRWLEELVEAVDELDRQAVPIVGVTWWPLFDFVDWSWASGGEVVEEFLLRDPINGIPTPVAPLGAPGSTVDPFLRRMGLYRLERVNGCLTPVATALVESFRSRADASRPDPDPLRS
jgi:beta-glucosidase/6-phospho-beta-glucosidase/beta-galactosidase